MLVIFSQEASIFLKLFFHILQWTSVQYIYLECLKSIFHFLNEYWNIVVLFNPDVPLFLFMYMYVSRYPPYNEKILVCPPGVRRDEEQVLCLSILFVLKL